MTKERYKNISGPLREAIRAMKILIKEKDWGGVSKLLDVCMVVGQDLMSDLPGTTEDEVGDWKNREWRISVEEFCGRCSEAKTACGKHNSMLVDDAVHAMEACLSLLDFRMDEGLLG